MSAARLERLLKARTTYDLLCAMAPDAARHVRLLALALLPPAERAHALSVRGGPSKLARAFLDVTGSSPEERALSAYRTLWETK